MNGGGEMPRAARIKSKTGVYHLMLRGANRQEIFHDEEDWRMFLEILKKYKLKLTLTIYAWCLMNNHVHLLMKEGDESISITMKRIGVSYAGYYNWKYRTTGHLFQDRFRSECVEDQAYFRTVVRYIHQNPVKAGVVMQPDDWKWSSCLGYYGLAYYPQGLLDSSFLLKLFSPNSKVAQELFKAFNEMNNEDQCLELIVNAPRLTDEEARQKIKESLGTMEIPHVKSLPREKRKEILRELKTIKGISMRQLARIMGISLNLVFKA
ncbi:REP-associated tyrosine transposase [Bacillus sinesaloumensis]|uniref:REP-associated tyrosine transposase n=1 Tax=Litchfieldia sinesaloumensis TaxID=1926280 RepID=UPI001F2DBA43|nr:transposase [Bacillus sinesaloumensis]